MYLTSPPVTVTVPLLTQTYARIEVWQLAFYYCLFKKVSNRERRGKEKMVQQTPLERRVCINISDRLSTVCCPWPSA